MAPTPHLPQALDLDPASTALVLIDLQHSNVARPLAPHSSAQVVANGAALAHAFRARGATVIYVNIAVTELLTPNADAPFTRAPDAPPPPANAAELVPEAGAQSGDIFVTKRQWGAFYGTALEQHLRRRGIQTIVLGGIATNIGVESTARAAFDLGYELVFAEDAMSSISSEAHQFSTTQLFIRMGRVRDSVAILQALAATPHINNN